MNPPEVGVIRTSAANLAAVLAAFGRLGARTRYIESAEGVSSASLVVLPGVGAFDAVRGALERQRLSEAVRDRVDAGLPTLAICLGLQILCEGSDEGQGGPGLGCMEGRVTRFPRGLSVPQMGWNQVVAGDDCRFLQSGYAYFANSYRLVDPPPGWAVARTEYGGAFVSAAERGGVLACQFHPELSGSYGRDLLRRWVEDAPRLAEQLATRETTC